MITLTKTYYSKTESGKSWKSNPDSVKTEEVTLDTVKQATSEDTLKFFRSLGGWEQVERAYTPDGYLPIQAISISPDRSAKVVRTYKYS